MLLGGADGAVMVDDQQELMGLPAEVVAALRQYRSEVRVRHNGESEGGREEGVKRGKGLLGACVCVFMGRGMFAVLAADVCLMCERAAYRHGRCCRQRVRGRRSKRRVAEMELLFLVVVVMAVCWC